MQSQKKPILGILGGLGPMSSVYFYELITAHTVARRDQEHIDIVLSSRASTPDRTDYIMGKSTDSPLPYMVEEALRLEAYGADVIVIPCNTAHYFIDEVRRSVKIPVPSIIEETAEYIKQCGYQKAGIMATRGTVVSGSYQQKLEQLGLEWEIPGETDQEYLHSLIYDDIKSGRKPNMEHFLTAAENLRKKGCDVLILGCTELSLIKETEEMDIPFADSLKILAHKAIEMCGAKSVGLFPKKVLR